MKGDFSRRTFRSSHHYSQVLMQQGRVQLDADWNEQADIASHLHRRLCADTIGSHGGPRKGAGMAIACQVSGKAGDCPGDQLLISLGRYYVDGILCENEQPELKLGQQPDLPGVELPADPGRYVAYLDVWTEHVSAVDRPELLEVALQGPDTASRARTVWQVRLTAAEGGTTCADLVGWTPPEQQSTGRLRARAHSEPTEQRPCTVPVRAGYRRLENQLYRVEIRDGSDAKHGATFVWSRENGSVVAKLDRLDGDVLVVTAPGRDDRLWFVTNGWVEVLPRERALRGEPGFLARLATPDGVRLPVAQWHPDPPPGEKADPPPTEKDVGADAVVRRWESAPLPVPADDKDRWVSLEDGVQVAFEPGGVLRTGDYWLIPARTANLRAQLSDLIGDVDWDIVDGEPAFSPPEGIIHRYAPIAILERSADNNTWKTTDCRRLFEPLTELTSTAVLSLVGGDGQEAMPGDPLPRPLEVLVSANGRPVPKAVVRFTAAAGDVATDKAALATAGKSVDISTGPDGIARCVWRLAASPGQPSQTADARLVSESEAVVGNPVHFSARLSLADQVWFRSGDRPAMAGVDTVQEALDRLIGDRPLPTRVSLHGGRELRRADRVSVTELVSGVAVALDGTPQTPESDPPLRMTVELPFPLSSADKALWGDQVIGVASIVLAGEVSIEKVGVEQSLVWRPIPTSRDFLERLFSVLDGSSVDSVRCVLGLLDHAVAPTGPSSGFVDERAFAFWLRGAGVQPSSEELTGHESEIVESAGGQPSVEESAARESGSEQSAGGQPPVEEPEGERRADEQPTIEEPEAAEQPAREQPARRRASGTRRATSTNVT